MARPTKYDPAMCKAVIEAGKEGKTLAEMAVEIGIARVTLNDWRENNPEFSYAVKEGLDHAQAWWEKLMRDGAAGSNPDVQPTLAIFNMKNRFRDDWADKVQTELSGKVQTEEVGQASRKLSAFLDDITSRTSSEPTE